MGRKSKEIKELEKEFEEELELEELEEDDTPCLDNEPEIDEYFGTEYFDIEDYE